MTWVYIKAIAISFSFATGVMSQQTASYENEVPVSIFVIPMLFFTFGLPALFARWQSVKREKYLLKPIWHIEIWDPVSFFHLIGFTSLASFGGIAARFELPMSPVGWFLLSGGSGCIIGVYTYLRKVKTGEDGNL